MGTLAYHSFCVLAAVEADNTLEDATAVSRGSVSLQKLLSNTPEDTRDGRAITCKLYESR